MARKGTSRGASTLVKLSMYKARPVNRDAARVLDKDRSTHLGGSEKKAQAKCLKTFGEVIKQAPVAKPGAKRRCARDEAERKRHTVGKFALRVAKVPKPARLAAGSPSTHVPPRTEMKRKRYVVIAPPRAKSRSKPETVQMLFRAAAFAADKHRHQRRKDAEASPYINHPIALADLLANEGGIADPTVLCAALLHDTIEDTDTTAAELEAVFGPEITAIVLEVTDDKSLAKDERKRLQIVHAPNASPAAKLVKLADKVCNLRDLLASPPSDWDALRKQAYFDWSAAVVAGLRGVHPELGLVFDGLHARHADLG